MVGFNFEEYFCKGESLELDAGIHTSYLWSTNETARTINVTSPGDYFVDLVDENKCKSRCNITVYQWELPEIVKVDTIPDSYITISAKNGASPYTYSMNSQDFQEPQTFSPVDPGYTPSRLKMPMDVASHIFQFMTM